MGIAVLTTLLVASATPALSTPVVEQGPVSTPLVIAIIAAIASLVAGLVGPTISGLVATKTHRQRLAADRDLARDKFAFERDLAERKLTLDQRLGEWRRRTELAEQVLADFYAARAIFQTVRQPMGFGGEGQSRPGRDAEDEQQRGARDVLYGPFERLSRESTFFAEMYSRRYRFMALFGAESGNYYHALTLARHKISLATQMLLGSNAGMLSDDRTEKYEAWIWNSGEAEDEIEAEINTAVSKIEAICQPILQMAQPTPHEAATEVATVTTE